ncbi:MAG: hypothetical protein JWO38_1540 [Gemmataceae bacterium]|nr:hypothetical protein [Gemmataceae bacterium]
MMPAGVVLLLAVVPSSPGESPVELEVGARRAFDEGVELRGDGGKARTAFARAAAAYDELWKQGYHNPALALNRARAHRLAGDLPGSIAAFHAGLAAARYDRTLQAALDDARAAVSYPLDGELATQCRPRPAGGIGARMSPAEAYLAAGLLWLMVCLGVARFVMTRAPWWLIFAGAWLVSLAVLGGLWWQDWRRQTAEESRPLVVVKNEVILRKGNGESYPPRLEPKLPEGAEARELTRRGGWVQVELGGGAVGWLPEGAVIGGER